MARYNSEDALNLYLTGLRNAHALEQQALGIMNRQIERLENYPDVLKRLRSHAKETEGQAQRVQDLLKDLNEEPSGMKDVGGQIMGTLAALGHSVAGDEILKNTMANYAFENYEIAAYKSLISVAEAAGQTKHVKALEQTLGEEIAMASWIEENVEAVTLRFLELSSAGKTAKV